MFFSKSDLFRRLIAKNIDLFLSGTLFAFMFSIPADKFALVMLAQAILFPPLEAIFLFHLGVTPGKALLGIKVTSLSNEKNIRSYLRRSYGAYTQALFLGVPPFSLLALIAAYSDYKEFGISHWDKTNGFTTNCERLSSLRFFAGSFLLCMMFNLQTKNTPKLVQNPNSRPVVEASVSTDFSEYEEIVEKWDEEDPCASSKALKYLSQKCYLHLKTKMSAEAPKEI